MSLQTFREAPLRLGCSRDNETGHLEDADALLSPGGHSKADKEISGRRLPRHFGSRYHSKFPSRVSHADVQGGMIVLGPRGVQYVACPCKTGMVTDSEHGR